MLGRICSSGIRIALTVNHAVFWHSALTAVAGMANGVAQTVFKSSFFKDCALSLQAKAPHLLKGLVPLLGKKSTLFSTGVAMGALMVSFFLVMDVRVKGSFLERLNKSIGKPFMIFNRICTATHPLYPVRCFVEGKIVSLDNVFNM